MCGIVGLHRSNQDAQARFPAALHALAWRGPDGAGQVDCGTWTLGVARLAITDRSAAQPISCEQSGRVVAFNGAVTSAADEWPEYEAERQTRNDAELLLLRFARRGAEALADMTGPYAFAVTDPETAVLWLGRDPMGEKPLHVVLDQGRAIAFASSIASLRALGFEISITAEDRARFFEYGFATGPFRVALEGRELELRSDLRGVHVTDRDGILRPLETAALTVAKKSSFEQALKDGLGRCAQAEVPMGLCLSGGIDSSCLAAILQQLQHETVGYQFRAAGEPGAERARAQSVADHFGQQLQLVDAGPEILQELPRLSAHTALPLGDPSVLAVHALARRAAKDGVRVLLSGEGADDLLLGYPRHHAAAHLPRRGLPFWSPRLSMSKWARLWRAMTAKQPYDALLAASSPGFRARALSSGGASAELQLTAETHSALERARRIDRDYYLRWDLLPKLDTATMAAGIEGRCPFLDPAVLICDEVTQSLATELVGKRPLIEAFGPLLPRGILDQKKQGFAIPLDRWFREDDFLADVLSDKRTLERDHISASGLRAFVSAQRAGACQMGHGLYLIAAYELWLRLTEVGA